MLCACLWRVLCACLWRGLETTPQHSKTVGDRATAGQPARPGGAFVISQGSRPWNRTTNPRAEPRRGGRGSGRRDLPPLGAPLVRDAGFPGADAPGY